ncbi:probable imidazolonepropionase [Dendronephthya gigantea]|uniref:probable imidazolonepropionase n=1 Tax=Dendronephthya gigantea TaxID=151771 RepID=UPI00106B260F|nr:probable imidazolonepropionase [Dendronephthya gigantea]XP_028414427.1 probable imidazolonepropionase [Dendronephthya gigantea]XP_028414428.1 probable imidazolonepropionase [Dendronephthya gigantea]XP_028414429.1 probable imidazolonepropionase [Dendronephthya gigantea]
MHRLLIKSARQVVTVCKNGETLQKGSAMNNICILNGPVSIVVNSDGNIDFIGEDTLVSRRFKEGEFERIVDATDCCIIPGLVDGHTHPVFAGDRVHEFSMKLAGASYMDVHKAGGGIHFTVDHVHKASEDELFSNLKEILHRMLRAGTTLLEAKSGYGLDTENEIKMLKVLERANKEGPIEISSTFCGAHAVPRGLTASEATSDIINKQLPKLKSLIDSGELHVDNIDVFCEKGVFELEDTKKILHAGKDIGLKINFHAEELNQLNSVELGVSLGAEAISHLEEISEKGIEMMAASSTVGVALPTTAYILKLKPPPVRKMIEHGAAVALGSDFNPNAFCLSMPLVMHLACVTFGMTMNEALVASTINAAASFGRSQSHGSLEVGKVADMLILDCPRWEHLIYQFGGHDHVIKHVVKKGKVLYSRQQ